MAVSDPQALLNNACCLSCLTDRQLLLIQTQLLFQQNGGTGPVTLAQAQSLLDASGCLDCLTQFQLLVIQTQLLNDIAAGGSSGGGVGGVICADADPAGAPVNGCTLAYNRLTFSLWAWDSNTSTWVQLIGP